MMVNGRNSTRQAVDLPRQEIWSISARKFRTSPQLNVMVLKELQFNVSNVIGSVVIPIRSLVRELQW